MRITRVSLWHVPLTSYVRYDMADGKTCDTVETVLLRIDTEADVVGWDEVCPIPHYLPAYARGVAPALEELATVLLVGDPVGPEALLARPDAHLPGYVYAENAIDIALWDITGHVAGLPRHDLLGGRRQEWLPLYHSATCTEPDEMARVAREAHRSGIQQFQAKLGAHGGNGGGWASDAERLVKVREAVGPGPLVYGDWNCGATSLDAVRVGRAVAAHDVMLEQPCRTIEECARVREAMGLPMKLDEAVHDAETMLRAVRLGCMDALAVKLSKAGGLSACRRLRDLGEQVGIRMCVEDTWGSDVTTAALLHLAAATEPRVLLNACDLSGYVARHEIAGLIVEPLQRIVPPRPGYLQTLRKLCDEHGAVLIFDEIVTGFRLSYGGAQELYGVTPDLATFGKIIGGSFPPRGDRRPRRHRGPFR